MVAFHSTGSGPAMRRKVLNPRAVVVLGLLFVIPALGVRRLHSYQFDRTRQFLRSSAMAALETGELHQAHTLLNQYLAMQPADIEARDKLSILLERDVGTPVAMERSFRINEDLLRDNLPQLDLRLRQARLAVRLQKFSDAEAHLKLLQPAAPESSEVWNLTGQVAEAMRHLDDARRAYQRSIGCPNPLPQSFAALARLTETLPGQPSAAEQLMQSMVAANPSAESWQIRAAWLLEQRRYSEALSDLWRSLDLDECSLRSNAMLVQCLQQDPGRQHSQASSTNVDDIQRAIPHLERLVTQHPRQPLYALDLAAVQWKARQRKETIQTLEAALQQNPRSFGLHRALIEYLLSDHQPEPAGQILERIPAGALPQAEREYLLGRLLLIQEQWSEAVQVLDRCVAFCPSDSEILGRAQVALAIARQHAGAPDEAVDAWRLVLARDPGSVEGRLGLASAWLDSEQNELAVAEYRQLLDVPGVAAWLASQMIQNNLKRGRDRRDWRFVEQLLRDENPYVEDPAQRSLLQADLLLAQGQVTAALSTLEQARSQHPDRPEVLRAMRRLHGELKSDLRERLLQVIAADPLCAEAHAGLLRIELAAGDTNAADALLLRIRSENEYPQLSEFDRRQLIVQSLQRADQLEVRQQRDRFRGWLHDRLTDNLEQCVQDDPERLPELVQELCRQGRFTDAPDIIRSHQAAASPTAAALSWLELARFSQADTEWTLIAAAGIRQLIEKFPASAELRVAYAETLLMGDYISDAKTSLEQILQADPGHPQASARLAWILSVQQETPERAGSLVREARVRNPESILIRDSYCRVLLSLGQYQEIPAVAAVGGSHSQQNVSSAALLYHASALLKLHQTEEARVILRELLQRLDLDPLLPADRRLLEQMERQLTTPQEL